MREQATPGRVQEQLNEQTSLLKALLKQWVKQDIYNKKIEANLILVEKELQAVKGECQVVKEELQHTKQQMADGITAIMSLCGGPD
jgi:ribosomal protein L15E